MERLRKRRGAALVYRCAKQRSEPTSDKRGAKADELHLTPLELIQRIAALVPPPRTHWQWHRWAMRSFPLLNLHHPSSHRRITFGWC